MAKTKLEQVISSLEVRERKDLLKWLIYRKKEKHDWVIFLKLMLKGKEMDEKAIWAHVYPGKPFKDTTYRSLRNRVMEAIETWLALNRFEADTLQRDIQVLWALESRLETEAFLKEFRKVRTRISREPLSRENLRAEYELVQLLIHHYTRHDSIRAQHLLPEMESSFDTWMISEKLLQNLTNIGFRGTSSGWDPSVLTKSIYDFVHEEASPHANILIEIQYQCCLMMTGELSVPQVIRLQEQIKEHISNFKEYIQRDFFALVFNYLQRTSISAGHQGLVQIFEWQKWGLASGACLFEGKLGAIVYRNFIDIGGRIGRFEEAADVLESFKSKLSSDNPEEDYEYGRILLSFYQKRYTDIPGPEALREFKNPIYRYATRILGLISAYEKVARRDNTDSDRESLMGAIRYVRERLRTEKPEISLVQAVLRWEAFLLAYNRLCKAFLPEEWASLHKDVEETRLISYKEWLLEKIQEGPSRWS